MVGYWEGFALGVFGGIGIEILKWYSIRDELLQKQKPLWPNSLQYWIVTGSMIIFGGFFVLVYLGSGVGISYFLAVHIGASTPLLLTGIGKSTPSIQPGKID